MNLLCVLSNQHFNVAKLHCLILCKLQLDIVRLSVHSSFKAIGQVIFFRKHLHSLPCRGNKQPAGKNREAEESEGGELAEQLVSKWGAESTL